MAVTIRPAGFALIAAFHAHCAAVDIRVANATAFWYPMKIPQAIAIPSISGLMVLQLSLKKLAIFSTQPPTVVRESITPGSALVRSQSSTSEEVVHKSVNTF